MIEAARRVVAIVDASTSGLSNFRVRGLGWVADVLLVVETADVGG